MLSFREGMLLARERNMTYCQPLEPEIEHSFTERRMINCCWPTHTFAFVGSVAECLVAKRRQKQADRLGGSFGDPECECCGQGCEVCNEGIHQEGEEMRKLKVKTVPDLTQVQREALQLLGCEATPFITLTHALIFAATCANQQETELRSLSYVISVEPMPTYSPA